MIQLEPESRYSADEYLNFWKGKAFPEYFYSNQLPNVRIIDFGYLTVFWAVFSFAILVHLTQVEEMYKYRKGEYSPEHSQIAKIDDPDIRELILHMILKISIAQLTPLSLGSSPATEKRSGAK
jgi:hypothetical protein